MTSLLLLLPLFVVLLSPGESFQGRHHKPRKDHYEEEESSEELCHFPFRFQRKMHHACHSGTYHPKLWCATTENYDRDQKWRYCGKSERPRGHCDSNPCQNNGVCEARQNGFRCSCAPGYHGKRCEREDCFGARRQLHIGRKDSWMRFHQPTRLEECHCSKKKIQCKAVHGKACARNPCLNGGHCLEQKDGWVCACPEGFSGPLCGIDHNQTCYSGNGHSYRGMVQSSRSGIPCLPWDSPILLQEFSSNFPRASSLGLGEHNFCRNPDSDSQPWCYVLQEGHLTWEFCNVTRCQAQPAALVRLKEDKEKAPGHCVEFSRYISPVCLPSLNKTALNISEECQIAGWGYMYEGATHLAKNLQEAHVPIMPEKECRSAKVLGNHIAEGMLCAGYLDGRADACQGDSGGPLVCEEQGRATLRGIVSWGLGCAQMNKPGVYTNVTHYLDWIQSKVH
ncbi:coagulation factor XII isoform X2 [Varanus komodoensis]|uniref:coagulation factor XII isoform X2 n=1 Tax=Varanus komodoensis TaxID=61221 RepID=UPI001CF78189|nr:coagulation factor XII isoform X2 [Varanus komodoensis]